MNKKTAVQILTILCEANPTATTELNFGNDFQLLIAVMLSAHTTDKSVNKATQTLFNKVKTASAMVKLGEENLKHVIKTVGLYNTKAKNIIKTCTILVKQHKGEIPNTRKDLEALPGVGRKTANIILNSVFNENTLGVDTHIFRVANRTEIAKGKTTREVEEKLLKISPKKLLPNLHHVLVLHGRYVCKAKKPDCKNCLVNKLCPYVKLLT